MASVIDARKFRHRVELQELNRRVANDDAIGGYSDEWEHKSIHWAMVQPASGLEAMRADQLEGLVTHKVTTRYIQDITVADRFIFQGRTLNIVSVLVPDEVRRWTVCMCREVVT